LRLQDIASDELKMSIEVLKEPRITLLTYQATHLVALFDEKLRDMPADESGCTRQTDLLG
jgi:hypothetical protein